MPFTYDLDGNLVQLDGKTGAFDGENRLVEFTPAVPAEGDKKLAFLYDYLGRRVKRETYAYGSGQWTKTEERRYVYDGWNLAQELDGANGLVRSYVWGLDLSQTPQGAGGVGGLLASVEGTDVYHYCYDANGNVGQLVKSSDGTVAAHYEYDPFGNTTWQSGPQADANPFRFSTKYNDTVSGLYYYVYRYYAPNIGRWVNRDPIGDMVFVELVAKRNYFVNFLQNIDDEMNLYRSFRNMPIDHYDYIGLEDVCEEAWNKGLATTSLGGIVCKAGVPYVCSWAKQRGFDYGIGSCVLKHEQYHLKCIVCPKYNNSITRGYAIHGDGELAQEECLAFTEALNCLERKKMSECSKLDAKNRILCEEQYGKAIKSAEDGKNANCNNK